MPSTPIIKMLRKLEAGWRDWNSTAMTPITCADQLSARIPQIEAALRPAVPPTGIEEAIRNAGIEIDRAKEAELVDLPEAIITRHLTPAIESAIAAAEEATLVKFVRRCSEEYPRYYAAILTEMLSDCRNSDAISARKAAKP